MSAADNQNGKAPSGTESHFALAMAQAHGENGPSGPPALTATPTMAGLLQALRRRWMLGAGVAIGATALAILAVFCFMPPKYNVRLTTRVVAKVGGADDIEFRIFTANMEALFRNPLVINAALNDRTADGRDIKDLEIVRSRGLNVNEWLEKNLKTDYLLGPEVLRVTLAADQADEASELLNAVNKAFLNEYTDMERTKKQQRLDDLRRQKDKIEEDLRKLRVVLANILKSLDVKDAPAALVQQGVWQNKLAAAEQTRRVIEDEYAKAESLKITSEARLKTIGKQPIPETVLREYYKIDPSLQGIGKSIADLDLEIADLLSKFPPQYAEPAKKKKAQLEKSKAMLETELKPKKEEEWRTNTRIELEFTVEAAESNKLDCSLRRDRIMKEIAEYERRVRESGPGGANEPAQVLAAKDKIKEKEKALEQTAQKISDVELEPLPLRIIPIETARPPQDRDRSQQTKIAGAGGLGIFVLALFGVAFFEFRSRKIGLPDDVTHGLGLKVIGTIPAMPVAKSGEAEAQGQLFESVDAIRTVLLHHARTQSLHVILVTSANSGEGKTTLATQLAASLARGWKRTLVIDGDLRHPATHTLFDVPQEPGLAEVLRGEVEPTDAIRATSFSRLWVLPAGNGDAHAIQALAQDNVRTLFTQLKQQYDFIIIDAPPVLPVTDSLLLGQHSDGVMFAILTEVSRAPAVYAAQQKLAPLGLRTLGAVVLGTAPEFGDKNYRYALAGN